MRLSVVLPFAFPLPKTGAGIKTDIRLKHRMNMDTQFHSDTSVFNGVTMSNTLKNRMLNRQVKSKDLKLEILMHFTVSEVNRAVCQ